MPITDSIGDMLTMIRNANQKFLEKVDMPASKFKTHIARILKEEGFISNYKNIEDHKQGILRIYLKYIGEKDKERVIKGIKRVSRPGLRSFYPWRSIPKVYGGLGINIVSTSRGVMTDEGARKERLGGELICSVW
ncbi:MAG: 30S ribosomal protein S8 [Elusimicrobia bacterium]|nr:30S ribosomal protein S8 [Elusimicrobiota bacterium]MBD3412090.1 30S ribosomal protein S8 [Elusimicrobiota bacterium]